MKRFISSTLLVLGLSLGVSYLETQAAPLILTQDVLPGDFSTEVVDLQNFLYTDPDTRITPTEVGRFGTETINGIAHFQNKYQRTILGPFRRLATGSAEVMTRFKIATIGIKQDPLSLKDPSVRSALKTLLSQTINKLDEEIANRNNPNYQSDVTQQDGTVYFRGRAVPDDVAIGRPGQYEVSDTEGFFVSDTGDQFHYELPATTLQPIDNPRTFDDLFHNYDYLQELQGEIIYTSLEPGAQPQTVVAGGNGVAIKKKPTEPSPTVNQNLFDSILGTGTPLPITDIQNNSVVTTSLSPLVLSSERYSHDLGVQTQVHIFGRNFVEGTQGLIYQNNKTYAATASVISDTEMYLTLPQNLSTGRAIVGIMGHPQSAIEIFVYKKTCVIRQCVDVEIKGMIPASDELVFDKEVTIVGKGFSRHNNSIETPVGMYHGIESRDGETLTFIPKYPFMIGLEGGTEGNDIPMTFRILNSYGFSNVVEGEVELKVMTTYNAQNARDDNRNGDQAKNTLIIDYFNQYGQEVEFTNLEGYVNEVRSALSEDGYKQVLQNNGESVVLGEPNEDVDTGFFAFFNKIFSSPEEKNKSFLESIGFVEPAYASTIPYGGRILYGYPCTCSANWFNGVLDPRGLVHILVVQPGYSRLYAYFNVYTPGAGLVGSFTPTTGTCWMYVGTACYVQPTTGVMDLFPGTGTTPL